MIAEITTERISANYNDIVIMIIVMIDNSTN